MWFHSIWLFTPLHWNTNLEWHSPHSRPSHTRTSSIIFFINHFNRFAEKKWFDAIFSEKKDPAWMHKGCQSRLHLVVVRYNQKRRTATTWPKKTGPSITVHVATVSTHSYGHNWSAEQTKEVDYFSNILHHLGRVRQKYRLSPRTPR